MFSAFCDSAPPPWWCHEVHWCFCWLLGFSPDLAHTVACWTSPPAQSGHHTPLSIQSSLNFPHLREGSSFQSLRPRTCAFLNFFHTPHLVNKEFLGATFRIYTKSGHVFHPLCPTYTSHCHCPPLPCHSPLRVGVPRKKHV